MPFILERWAIIVPRNEAPSNCEGHRAGKPLTRLAVRPSSHWDVMECGTLNKNEALCGDIDTLISCHFILACVCPLRAACVVDVCTALFHYDANAGDVTNLSGSGSDVAYRFLVAIQCLRVCVGWEVGREGGRILCIFDFILRYLIFWKNFHLWHSLIYLIKCLWGLSVLTYCVSTVNGVFLLYVYATYM